MDKNTTFAVILIIAFISVWYGLVVPIIQPKRDAPNATGESRGVESGKPAEPKTTKAAVKKSGFEGKNENAVFEDFVVETDSIKIVFNESGGSVKNYFLKEKKGLIDLVPSRQNEETRDLFLNTLKGRKFRFESKEDVVIDGKKYVKLRLLCEDKRNGLSIIKNYLIAGKGFLHKLELEIINKSRETIDLPDIKMSAGPGVGGGPANIKENLRESRVIGYKNFEVKKLKEGTLDNDFAWFGLDNRYFLLAFLPDKKGWKKVRVVNGKNDLPELEISTFESILEPGLSVSIEMDLYYGPKSYFYLKLLGLKLEESVDFGFFGVLGKIAIKALYYLNGITKNYGLAIVVLTVFLQILMFPLTAKSFKASLAMKKVQPQMKMIQEKYKNDPQRLNKEMMNLYRTSGTNPLGGCLPAVMQLPIFLALFTTLRNAYELRNAPFIFWIRDLSAPDPFYVLPILMGIMMFVQQKMMSVSSDPMQAKMAYIFPVVLTFVFLKFPAGLVLYWLTNSIVTSIEQYIMLREHQKKELKK